MKSTQNYFAENPPARSTMEAARLPRDVRVEIDAIADRWLIWGGPLRAAERLAQPRGRPLRGWLKVAWPTGRRVHDVSDHPP